MVFWQGLVVKVDLAGNDFLRDFPSMAVGVCYLDSQYFISFKAAEKEEKKMMMMMMMIVGPSILSCGPLRGPRWYM